VAYDEGSVEFSYKGERLATWYRIAGNRSSDKVALLVLQGEPGSSHDHLVGLEKLSVRFPVIHFDQVGNGRSSRIPDHLEIDLDLFVTEVKELLDQLSLPKCVVLGHNWGGIVAQELAIEKPESVTGLILSSTTASVPVMKEEAERLLCDLARKLPNQIGADPKALVREFRKRHVCRLDPIPEPLDRSLSWIKADPKINRMFTERFSLGGKVAQWSSIGRLEAIKAPTLIVSGSSDMATHKLQRQLLSELPDATWHVIKDSSHSTYLENEPRYLELVARFVEECAA
jgi:L-proline amide hydrolase